MAFLRTLSRLDESPGSGWPRAFVLLYAACPRAENGRFPSSFPPVVNITLPTTCSGCVVNGQKRAMLISHRGSELRNLSFAIGRFGPAFLRRKFAVESGGNSSDHYRLRKKMF